MAPTDQHTPRETIRHVDELDYTLPAELIAQNPPERREDARLLIVDRTSGPLHDAAMIDLPDLLRAGDLLVMNDTKVLPARFSARRATGGRVEGLFVEEDAPGRWRVMLKGSRRLHVEEELTTADRSAHTVTLRLTEFLEGGHWRVAVTPAEPAEVTLERIGNAPLPPYIRRGGRQADVDQEDRKRYQTIYARVPGAIAAPTAGLHLTEALLERVRERGVDTGFVTLHVGVGTFKPIAVERLADHPMHAERYELPEPTAAAARLCRREGGRIVAVGTTTVRVLESAATGDPDEPVRVSGGSTDLFIRPPHTFRAVDVLLTNFHLPRSTLLALVMAFAGVDTIRRAYAHAVENRYRFYSFGDAMLIM